MEGNVMPVSYIQLMEHWYQHLSQRKMFPNSYEFVKNSKQKENKLVVFKKSSC